MMDGKLIIHVVGQDVLKSYGEVSNHWTKETSVLMQCKKVDINTCMLICVFSLRSQVKFQCTILTDNYCEEAYNLLENSMLKKLLVCEYCKNIIE